MSNMKKILPTEAVSNSRVTLVVSRYNNFVVDRLLEGCLATLKAGGIGEENMTLVQVPGAFEIPVAVKKVIDAGNVV